MSRTPIIAGMWGTTHLTAFLIDADDADVAFRRGPGVARIRDKAFETALTDLVGDWIDAHSGAPIVLAGMIGSSVGWKDAGYVDCPARAEAAVRQGVDISVRGRAARIVRGLACVNVLGEPDVLRGEETEVLGWALDTADAGAGQHLLCVPGTHAKWIVVRDGVIESFLSSAAGELFAALHADGVLTDQAAGAHAPEVFREAVRDAGGVGASLPHLLFTVRARTVRGQLARKDAASRLSGLIVGADVAGAGRLLSDRAPLSGGVTVIGAPEISARYAEAIEEFGGRARVLDSKTASVAGLRRAAQFMLEGGVGA